VKVKEVRTNVAIYSHALLKDTCHQRSKVGEDSSSLPASCDYKYPHFICTSFTFGLMTTRAFSRNGGKLSSKLKLVSDNLLSIYGWLILFKHLPLWYLWLFMMETI